MISKYGIEFKNTRKTAQHNNSITVLNIPMMKILNLKYKINFIPIPSDTKANLFIKAAKEEETIIIQAIELALNSLERTLDFIVDNNLTLPDRVEYINFILSFYIYNEHLNENEYKDYIIKWYKDVDFNDLTNTQKRNIFDKFIHMKR